MKKLLPLFAVFFVLGTTLALAQATMGKVWQFGRADGGTLPPPTLGGIVYDAIGQTLLASDGGGWVDICAQPDGGLAAPDFFFADPLAYAGFPAYSGLPAADGCKAPWEITGGRGEALTFTRAGAVQGARTLFCPVDDDESSGTNCDGGTTANNAEVCLRNRMISAYNDATNAVSQPEAFDNAAWSKTGTGVAAPAVTANYATAPDGTATAERVIYPACPTVGNSSNVYQANGSAGFSYPVSLWLKGNNADAGRVSLCYFKTATTSGCLQISLTTAWRRYKIENIAAYALSNYFVFGCNNDTANYADAGDTGAVDLSVWGASRTDPYPYVVPYTKNGTALGRESFVFAFNSSALADAGSVRVDFQPNWPSTYARQNWAVLETNSTSGLQGIWSLDAGKPLLFDGTNVVALTGGFPANRVTQIASNWADGGMNIKNVTDGITVGGLFDGTMGTSTTAIRVCMSNNSGSANHVANGLCGNVCADHTATRCFP